MGWVWSSGERRTDVSTTCAVVTTTIHPSYWIFRTTFTRMIIFNLLVNWLLGSNLSQFYGEHYYEDSIRTSFVTFFRLRLRDHYWAAGENMFACAFFMFYFVNCVSSLSSFTAWTTPAASLNKIFGLQIVIMCFCLASLTCKFRAQRWMEENIVEIQSFQAMLLRFTYL